MFHDTIRKMLAPKQKPKEILETAVVENENIESIVTKDNPKKKQAICSAIVAYKQKSNARKVHMLCIGAVDAGIASYIKENHQFDLSITTLTHDSMDNIIVNEDEDINEEKDIQDNSEIQDNTYDINEFIFSIVPDQYDIIFISDFDLLQRVQKPLKNTINMLSKFANMLLLDLDDKDMQQIKGSEKVSLYDVNLLDNISYYKVICDFFRTDLKTHAVLYVASNKFVYLNDKFLPIEHYHNSFDGMRRAYLCGNNVIKILYKNKRNAYGISDKDCIIELKQEIDNCQIGLSFTPTIDFVEETDEYFISILKLKHKGISNLQVDVQNYAEIEGKLVNVLDNLIELEDRGLYHYDLTPWNIMVNKQQNAFLIDAGAIVTKNVLGAAFSTINNLSDKKYYNTFDAFVSIVHDVLTSKADQFFYMNFLHLYVPSVFFDQNTKIPQEFKNFFIKYQVIDRNKMSFKLLKDLFTEFVINKKALILTPEEEVVYGLVYEKRREDSERLKLLSYKAVCNPNT